METVFTHISEVEAQASHSSLAATSYMRRSQYYSGLTCPSGEMEPAVASRGRRGTSQRRDKYSTTLQS